MGELVAAKVGTTERVPTDFVGKLQWLRRFGKPRLSMANRGWHASIEMNTNATGTSFDVKSEFGHDDPTIALDQMIERMLAALASLASSQEVPDGGR